MIIGLAGSGKLRVRCELCGRERVVNRSKELQRKSTHRCRKCYLISKKFKEQNKGRVAWNKGSVKLQSERRLGNKYTCYNGYVHVYMGKPEGRTDGYLLEHRMIMEATLGRRLAPDEIVHHIDGVKTNNNVSNLHLCASKTEHRYLHSSLEDVAFELVRAGVIKFDAASETYVADLARNFGCMGEE